MDKVRLEVNPKVRLEISINGSVSKETLSEIIGNIVEHVENENKFWHEEAMLNDNQAVTAVVLKKGAIANE